jgi:methionyl-tRNA formyltransferase
MSPKIVYVTCAENGLIGLKYLLSQAVQIVAVVTIGQEVATRASVSGYVDVKSAAKELGVSCIELSSYNLNQDHLRDLTFDILVVNGWNRLIPADVIELAKMGAIGLHAGHPPIGLGRAPLVWNILLGHSDIEVYAFRLTANADDGDILAKRVVEITPYDSVRLLYEKVSFWGARLLETAIWRLSDNIRGEVQEAQSIAYYAKRQPSDGLIDFSWDDKRIRDFVRAQSDPYPGAFSFLKGTKWLFDEVVPFDRFAFREVNREPGRIVAALPAGIVILTGGAPLWLLKARVVDSSLPFENYGAMERLVGARFGKEA